MDKTWIPRRAIFSTLLFKVTAINLLKVRRKP